MRVFAALRSNAVEVVTAAVLVGAGIYVTSVGSSATTHGTGLLTAGGIMTAFGGILISWIASGAHAREQAERDFGLQLGNLSRNLGQAAGQLARAVEQAQTREIHPATGLALISQANRMVYGQVNEIAVIQGVGFDPAYLLETASKLDNLARELESQEKGAESLANVRRELEHVRTTLSQGPVRRTYAVTEVNCPYCGSTNQVELGNIPGDTATAICLVCQNRYNAHRSPAGSAFTRKIGENHPSAAGRRWSFQCPSCAADLTPPVGTRNVVCTSCHTALTVNSETQSVIAGEKYTHSWAAVRNEWKGRPILSCPSCGQPRRAILNTGSTYMAYCTPDLQLMEVSHTDWHAWRDANRLS
jgi:hypothetical protein